MATRRRRAFAALASSAALTGLACGSFGGVAPVVPPSGFLFTQRSAPLETIFETTPLGTKQGTSQVRFIQDPIFTGLAIITWGDGSVRAAAQEGGIQTVHYVDLSRHVGRWYEGKKGDTLLFLTPGPVFDTVPPCHAPRAPRSATWFTT